MSPITFTLRITQTHLVLPYLLLLMPRSGCEEVTPSSLLGPRNFNYHPYEMKQYLRETSIEPTKQGPVLFPNDAPPPPRPPLIVTSRPLIESIARSELNPIVNNSIAEQSQLSHSFKPYTVFGPDYVDKVRDYKPFVYPVARFDYDYGGNRIEGVGTERYNDFVEHTSLPPIYQAIADHAQQKVLKLKQKEREHQYQVREPEPEVNTHRGDYDDDQASNYAFSYKVKDQKTGDDFSHTQQSSGSATNGEYRVRLPDGRMQIVSYTADENGYKADVRYDDEDKTRGNSIDYGHNHYRDHGHDDNKNDHSNHYRDHGHDDNKNDHSNHYRDHGHDNNKNDHSHNKHGHNHNKIDHLLQFKVPEHKHYNIPEQILYKGLEHADNYLKDHNLAPNYHGPDHRIDYNQQNYYKDINANDYIQNRDYKPAINLNSQVDTNINSANENYKAKEDFNQYSDLSKEYYGNDYSVEYDGQSDNYNPHRSKFSIFAPQSTDSNQNLGVIVVPNQINNKETTGSTVKPSYEELKDLFVNKNLYNVQPTDNKIPVEINVPSTTAIPNIYDETTEHVVVIGTTKPNVYANRNLQTPVTPSVSYSTSNNFVTPRNYLESTIESLKHRNDAKPVLSPSFISRINKYLNFNK